MDFSLLGFSGLRQVYNIHPVLVHFPVALFPSALLLYFLGFLLNRRALNVAGRSCLYLASAGALLAVLTGRLAEASIPHNDIIHHMMKTHETIGYTVLVLSLVLAAWSFRHMEQRPRGSVLFLLLLTLNSFLVLQNGDIGLRMVFIEGAGVRPAVGVIQSSPATDQKQEQDEPTESQHDHSTHEH